MQIARTLLIAAGGIAGLTLATRLGHSLSGLVQPRIRLSETDLNRRAATKGWLQTFPPIR